jgi:hypothetical protein
MNRLINPIKRSMSAARAPATPLRELIEAGGRAAPLSSPQRLLDEFLAPARDPEAAPNARIESYRLLLMALEGNLVDREFASSLHREWMACSARRAGPATERRGGAPRRLSRSARR